MVQRFDVRLLHLEYKMLDRMTLVIAKKEEEENSIIKGNDSEYEER